MLPLATLPLGVPASMTKLPMPVCVAASNFCAQTVLPLGAGPTTKKLDALMKSVKLPQVAAVSKLALVTTRKFSSLRRLKPQPISDLGRPEIAPPTGSSVSAVVACAAVQKRPPTRAPTKSKRLNMIRLLSG